MEERGTQVHQRWSKVGKSKDIDPNFRRVDQKEVEAIFKGVTPLAPSVPTSSSLAKRNLDCFNSIGFPQGL